MRMMYTDVLRRVQIWKQLPRKQVHEGSSPHGPSSCAKSVLGASTNEDLLSKDLKHPHDHHSIP